MAQPVFSEAQYQEIGNVLTEALRQAGNKAATNLKEKHEGMEVVARNMAEQQEQIRGHMDKSMRIKKP